MSRNAPNLYELLKQSRSKMSSGNPAEPAEKSAAPPMRVVVAPPEPEPAMHPIVHAPPRATFELPSVRKAKEPGLGERMLHLTYNTAAFVGLVIVGLIFIGYAVGVRAGRASAETSQPPAPPPRVEPAAPVTPPAVYTIRLMEWPGRTSQERTTAQSQAGRIKSNLEGQRLPDAVIRTIGDKVVLDYGRFTDLNSAETKGKLAVLKDFRLARNQPPTFRQASFVRAD